MPEIDEKNLPDFVGEESVVGGLGLAGMSPRDVALSPIPGTPRGLSVDTPQVVVPPPASLQGAPPPLELTSGSDGEASYERDEAAYHQTL